MKGQELKALVTGGLGFVGSNLVDRLINLGWEVHVVDDLSSGNNEHRNPKAAYTIADFKEYLDSTDASIDVVFHLAAESRIQPSFEDPLYTCHNNSHGSAVVAEFARQSNCKVVYAGSSSYYGGVYLNPYAFAKWQGEEVFKMYSAVYDSSCGIARFFNVYGPRNPLIGQYTPVVAIFEEQTKANQTLTIVGDGDQRRDFTHVYDICDGLIAISNGDWRGEVFNLGTGTNHSVNELAKMFGGERKHLPERKGEARETLADISFTTEKTGWTPNYSLEGYVAEWSKNR
jgi:nucleoside-diphosphate-sugar epimerase